MSRRIPLKVKASPASQRPENQAVEHLVETSRALQDKMRQSADSHAEPRNPGKGARRQPEKLKTETDRQAPRKGSSKPARRAPLLEAKETVDRAPQDDEKAPAPASSATTDQSKPDGNAEVIRRETRLSLYVPVNQAMIRDADRIAMSLGKGRDYVLTAFLKRAFDAMTDKAQNGDLRSLKSDAMLLLDQHADGGTISQRLKRNVEDAWVSEGHRLLEDPLNVFTDAKVMAAFVGAALLEKLKEA